MKKIFFNMLGLTILCQSVFGMNVVIDSPQDGGQNQISPLRVDEKASQEDDRTVQYQTSLLYLDMKTLRKDGRIVLYYLDNNDGTFVGEPIILQTLVDQNQHGETSAGEPIILQTLVDQNQHGRTPKDEPIMLEKTSYIGTISRDQNQVNFAIHENDVDHIHGELSDEIELDNEYEIAQRQQNFKQTQTVWHDMFVTFVQDQKSPQVMNGKLLVQPTPGKAMRGKLLKAIENGDLGIVQTLFDNGVDVNIAGKYGWTLLHDACYSGHLDVVEYLISRGADPNAQTNKQWTPLHLACENGHLDIVQYLISKGANINATDLFNNTPLHYAQSNNYSDIVAYLQSQMENQQ